MNASTTEPYLRTVNEACRLTTLSRTTIYRLIQTGKLEHVKVGGRTMITTRSILTLALGGQ